MNREEIVERVTTSLIGRLGNKAPHVVEAIASYVDLAGFVSNPPSGCHKIYNIYARKIGDTYQPVIEVESVPEP